MPVQGGYQFCDPGNRHLGTDIHAHASATDDKFSWNCGYGSLRVFRIIGKSHWIDFDHGMLIACLSYSSFFALKCLGTLLAPTIPAFYMVQLFQPLGWGLMTVASVYYVNSIMQDRDRIKGQAYMTMTLSIGTIIGTLTGGVLIDLFGVNGMLAVSVAAGVAGMAVLMATIGRDEMSRR